MIITLKSSIPDELALSYARDINAFLVHDGTQKVLVTSSSVKELPASVVEYTDTHCVLPSDMQLSSKAYRSKTRKVSIGNIEIGGDTKNTIVIGGPCSVESEEQIRAASSVLSELGLKTLRGGCYKPRTSPYSFQGLGLEGLKLLRKMKEEYGHTIITEARDASHINEIIEHTDVVQVGAKAMYDQGILRACAKSTKVILIKRGFGTTLQEFVQAAEFVMSGGNLNVVLCERGIRTFETGTRFTLDLCGVAWLKEYCNLPVILDPSHAIGYAYGVPSLAKACVAMGVDGLLIETHPHPKNALSDASQQLNFEEFKTLMNEIKPLASCVGYSIV
ncbi:MAG: 3-deoxy-7-phosphoheptulonate synthase [Bacteroidetes bacterium]|nr:3-deoxy-7-phosphoheptulonate synthase [Bacteroidota bacterium]